MACVENSLRILFSLLFFDSVFATAIEATHRSGIDEDDGIYGEYRDEGNNHEEGDILKLDFFRFTTRKRYIWEDWTVPTLDPIHNRDGSSSFTFVLYFIVSLAAAIIVGVILYCCIKKHSVSDPHSSTSADIYTTVHGYSVANGLDSFGVTVHATAPNISFVNSSYAFSTRDRSGPDSEKPPDYSTVTLSDLVNPAKPTFPVVRKDKETPPPAYGKENPLFK